jgi:1-phosphatidylinositol-4-phosphate 5-kinase
MSERHRFQYGKKILHISIIDYLQQWNISKKAERAYKTVVLRKDPVGLSAVEPVTYAERFRQFAKKNVFEDC